MFKVTLFVVLSYYSNTLTTNKFEMDSMEHCETQAKLVKEVLKSEGYSVDTVCVDSVN